MFLLMLSMMIVTVGGELRHLIIPAQENTARNVTVDGKSGTLRVLSRRDYFEVLPGITGIDCSVKVETKTCCGRTSRCKCEEDEVDCVSTEKCCPGCEHDYMHPCATMCYDNSRKYTWTIDRLGEDSLEAFVTTYTHTELTLEFMGNVYDLHAPSGAVSVRNNVTAKRVIAAATSVHVPLADHEKLFRYNKTNNQSSLLLSSVPAQTFHEAFFCVDDPVQGITIDGGFIRFELLSGGNILLSSAISQFTSKTLDYRPIEVSAAAGCDGHTMDVSKRLLVIHGCSGGELSLDIDVQKTIEETMSRATVSSIEYVSSACSVDDGRERLNLTITVSSPGMVALTCAAQKCMSVDIYIQHQLHFPFFVPALAELTLLGNDYHVNVRTRCEASTGSAVYHVVRKSMTSGVDNVREGDTVQKYVIIGAIILTIVTAFVIAVKVSFCFDTVCYNVFKKKT